MDHRTNKADKVGENLLHPPGPLRVCQDTAVVPACAAATCCLLLPRKTIFLFFLFLLHHRNLLVTVPQQARRHMYVSFCLCSEMF